MKIDFNQYLKNLQGVPFQANGSPVPFHTFITAALLHAYPEDAQITGEEKFNRFNIAAKVHNQGEVEVSDEDIATMKLYIGKFYGVELVGPAYLALSSGSKSEADEATPVILDTTSKPKRRAKLVAAASEGSTQQ